MTFLTSPSARRFAATIAATATVLAVMTAVAIPDRITHQGNYFDCSNTAGFSTVRVETRCHDNVPLQYRL